MHKKVLIASDHAGFELKTHLMKNLNEVHWIDLGPHTTASVDYPDFAHKLAGQIAQGQAELGVLICGSGIGMSIAANKTTGVRAAMVENPVSAKLAREHNHANVLCLGARFVAGPYAMEIIQAWLHATPSLEERHKKRVHKIETRA